MKEFIINVLTALGFGLNAYVPQGEKLFAGKMQEMFPATKFDFKRTENGFDVIVTENSDSNQFIIRYVYGKDGKRIGSMEII